MAQKKKVSDPIDRKFKIVAISRRSKKKYTEQNSILFLAKDALLVATLDRYLSLCIENAVDQRQIKGVELLIDRVKKWQAKNQDKLHMPDVAAGAEAMRICKENAS